MALAGVGAWRHRGALGASGLLIFLALGTAYAGDTGQSINTLFSHSDAYPTWADDFFLTTYLCLMAAVRTVSLAARLVQAVETQSQQLAVLARTDGLTGLANRGPSTASWAGRCVRLWTPARERPR